MINATPQKEQRTAVLRLKRGCLLSHPKDPRPIKLKIAHTEQCTRQTHGYGVCVSQISDDKLAAILQPQMSKAKLLLANRG